jgi:hypothetical protein
MSMTSRRTTPHQIVTRHFESSRHHRDNLVAAYEKALPIIRRDPSEEPVPRHVSLPAYRHRRACS